MLFRGSNIPVFIERRERRSSRADISLCWQGKKMPETSGSAKSKSSRERGEASKYGKKPHLSIKKSRFSGSSLLFASPWLAVGRLRSGRRRAFPTFFGGPHSGCHALPDMMQNRISRHRHTASCLPVLQQFLPPALAPPDAAGRSCPAGRRGCPRNPFMATSRNLHIQRRRSTSGRDH